MKLNPFIEVRTPFGDILSERVYFDTPLLITDVVESTSRNERRQEATGLGRFGSLYLAMKLAKRSSKPTTLSVIEKFSATVGIERYQVIRHDDVNRILVLTLKSSFFRSLNPFVSKVERKIWFRVVD